MKVLLLSAGTRVNLVRYFRQALPGGAVIAADADGLSPALYAADRYHIVPPVTAPDHMERILTICRKERIDGVLSLIDPELSVLAKQEARFAALGTKLVGSARDLCEFAYDKRRTYRWLSEHGYPCAGYWTASEDFFRDVERGAARFPVFVKPIQGSASTDAAPAADREALSYLLSRREGMLIQEYLSGQEIGADVYVDLISGEPVSIFTKKKLRMRAGETDRAVSFRDEKLFALIGRFVAETGFRGPLDIDLFERDGEYCITDVNPRFGGGYPHAHEAGCDHVRMIVENLKGNVNRPRIGAYAEGIIMMKYNEVRLTSETVGPAGPPDGGQQTAGRINDAGSGKSI